MNHLLQVATTYCNQSVPDRVSQCEKISRVLCDIRIAKTTTTTLQLFNGLFFQDNLGKPVQERQNQSRFR